MRKPKRVDLVQQIITETGITSNRKTPAYFSRDQLLELFAIIRELKCKIASLTCGEKRHE